MKVLVTGVRGYIHLVDQAVCYADPAKSKKVLGWEATRDQTDMCRDSWSWQRQNPNGYDE